MTMTAIQVICDNVIFMVHDLALFPVHMYSLPGSFTMWFSEEELSL